MRYYYVEPFPRGLRSIILATVVVFFIQLIFQATGSPRFILTFGLVPRLFWRGFIWQIFTYMFLHGGFFHIFINMFILWMFGRELETLWGTGGFLRYYFITGVGAGVITALFRYQSAIPVIGASGAIYAVLLAFGMLFPNRPVFLFFFIPMPAKFMVLLFFFIEFFSTLGYARDNIAHIAHLGGMVIGFIYLRVMAMSGPWREKRRIQRELDRILMKLSREGWDSLELWEKNFLREYYQ